MFGRISSVLIALMMLPALAYAWSAWDGNSAGWEVNRCPTVSGASCTFNRSQYTYHYCQTGTTNCNGTLQPRWDLAMLVAEYECEVDDIPYPPCIKCDYWFYEDGRCCVYESATAPSCPYSYPP